MPVVRTAAWTAITQFVLLCFHSIFALYQVPRISHRIDYWLLLIIVIIIPSLISINGIKCMAYTNDKVVNGALSVLFSILYVSVYVSYIPALIATNLLSLKSTQDKTIYVLYGLLLFWSLTAFSQVYQINKMQAMIIYEQWTKTKNVIISNYSILILLTLL